MTSFADIPYTISTSPKTSETSYDSKTDLPFLGVWVKTKENHPKSKGFFTPQPQKKNLEKPWKTAETIRHTKKFPWSQKTKENQNTK